MRCDAVLYLIPEVITNPKRDIINPKHDITKNAPNNKANILILSSSTKTQHAAYNSRTEYNKQNITTLQISRSFAYRHAKSRSISMNTANNSFDKNIISNSPLKPIS